MTDEAPEVDMGRPQAVSEDELVDALRAVLEVYDDRNHAVETEDVAAEMAGVSEKSVRNHLLEAREREESPIAGRRPGGQGGWVWWLTEAELYSEDS